MEPTNLTLREYLRVSFDKSGVGKSPSQQHDEMAAGARQKGWTLHPSPYRDTDRSASRYAKKAREGFADLMTDLEDGNFDAHVLADLGIEPRIPQDR